MSTITLAAREYASRPADERFESVSALVNSALVERQQSKEVGYNFKDLRVISHGDPETDAIAATSTRGTLQLESPKGRANFTHWSFGQLCRSLGAPASYLRELPPAIAANALNYGLTTSPAGTVANLLVRAANGHPEPTIRACTSDSYGRLWDSELYDATARQIMNHDARWTLPPVWPGQPVGGAYRGDRDSFLIVTNGGSIVTDPSAGQNGEMYRGILLRNSEVGASSVVIDMILYRYICGNHNLWGATMDRSFRRRHFGSHVLRDVVRQISTLAREFTQQSAAKDEAIIRGLISHELAATKDAVIDELRKIGYTKEQATDAFATCEAKENASPRSYWGLAQGTTRNSQTTQWQDDRYLLDQLAAKVLARGTQLVKV